MKDNKNYKKTDVDLENLEFFNLEEFNKFMSNLLNQDALSPKTREGIFSKINTVEKLYKDIKTIIETPIATKEKQLQFNSLLSQNSFGNVETLKDYIDKELESISTIVNNKIEQLGISVVDYFAYADDEIKQRVEEISDSTTKKIAQTEAELEVLTNALSNNADFVESEIERKTEKLGNEINSMTGKLSPSTSLAVIKPSFSKILKRILNERAISKKNYNLAPKTIKSTYPTPKSYFRCLFEAYYEYNDAKQVIKDSSENNLQMQILKKRQTAQELQEYLLALQNKENMELNKSKYQSNLALEILPNLNKLITANTTSTSDFNIKIKNDNYYKELLVKLDSYLPASVTKPTLTVINTESNESTSVDEIKNSLDSQNTEIAVENVEAIVNEEKTEIENIEKTEETAETITTAENTADIAFEAIPNEPSIENDNTVEYKSDIVIDSNVDTNISDSNENVNEIILDDSTSTAEVTQNNIKTKSNVVTNKVTQSIKNTNVSKDGLEKIRVKTQQKLQKAQDEYDKVTNKAQEKLERAKATAELEIKKIKDQAIEILKNAIDTANGIVDNANIESENLLSNAMTSSTEVISIANQKSKTVLENAEKAANDLIEKATTTVENIKKEATEKCKSIVATAEEKSNSIIINANNEADELMSCSKTESDDILVNIDTKIQETKAEIIKLKESIVNDKKQIITSAEKQKVLAQNIKKVEQLRAAATNIGVEDEINNLTKKLNEYFVEIKNSKKAAIVAKENIQKSHDTIIELTNSLPTLRSSLEQKAKDILVNAKQKSTELLENSRKEAKSLKEQARQSVKEITEKTNIDIKSIIENSEKEARKIKENARIESIEIIKQANSSSQSILDTAQVKSEELKIKAQEEAELLKATKKAELEFILAEEDFEQVC